MKNKKYNTIITILILILLTILLINFFLNLNKPIYTKEIQVKFQVDDFLGLIINNTTLDFGSLVRETSSTKTIKLTNEFSHEVLVKININPELQEFIFGKTDFIIKPYETKEYPVTLFIPKNAELKKYSGKIIFNFYKSK